MESLVTAVGFMGSLTLLLAALLALANRRFFVVEEPRISHVEEMLPQTNCGACGYPGCHAFAEALVRREVLPGQCNISSLEAKQRIAAYLNVATGSTEKFVARLACAGGNNVSRFRADYVGPPSCRAATQVSGGPKVCNWGCLGFGDCESVCNFDAIDMGAQGLPHVSAEQCTGCGDCVKTCPKDLFTLEPISHRLWVACKNEESGDSLLISCEVACTACGRCAMDAPEGLITMRGNLPRIDYTLSHGTQAPIQRCPTGAIVWINSDDTVTKGRESKKIVRHAPLPATGS
jgi:Na+-translocating ferredoxin:NAD+ oxidoreductase RNF subunit RnfB